ncbi:MAG: tyrosine-type recombinase/integrase [Desulfamplus sp.]
MLKIFTKHLFGKLKSNVTDEEIIIDGQIISRATGEELCYKNPLKQPSETTSTKYIKPEDIKPEPEQVNTTALNIEEQEQAITNQNSEAGETLVPEPEPSFKGFNIPEGYKIFLGASGKSGRTISEYCYDLNWWNGKKPLQSIGWRDIEKSINKMHAATARRKIAVLRSYARWLLREGHPRLHNEIGRIIPPKIPGRVPKDRGSNAFKELSKQAAELCRKGDRRGLWIGLMLCCGLRISEIKEVELASEQNIRVIGKGNKERLLPAPKWLYTAIADKENKTWRCTRQLIWKELKEMAVKRPHSLRHTYASELIRCGLQLEEVKELLGHSKLDTTLIYAKIKVPEQVTQRLGVEDD